MGDDLPTQPDRPLSIGAAYVSIAATVLFLVLLAVLHLIKPELSPSWRLISEYEIGRQGWLMQLAFITLAIGMVALGVAIRPRIQTLGGYVGLALMLVATAGLVIAGSFISDPVMTTRDSWSSHGARHAWGALMVIPTSPLFTTLVTRALSVRNGSSVRPMWLTTIALWLSFVAFALGGGTRVDGTQGPGDWYGWANRAFIVALGAWIIVVAWKALGDPVRRSVGPPARRRARPS